ncbi:4-hydroxyphenylacetate 3-hydroxylase N-terminal domain-containing protein [Nocardioides zeae]|uniref:Pyoverdin chromophore biosynthetic protein pvcC n=1 Tax=Nocardioides zeae TaxID=1457234 RepID=A0A6P0HGM6_9ACTN|nr:Pyoverdin chromophore biosynthetic protein pvcC [Nocardioides zeae]
MTTNDDDRGDEAAVTTYESTPGAVRPFTGAEYLDSLVDGREVVIHGERVKDVTTHPAFAANARVIAGLYDALWEEPSRSDLTVPTDTGNGGFTHPFFRPPRSKEDLETARTAIEAWQRRCYGWLGRTPDYKASFLATLGANADFYGEYAPNARRWFTAAQERVLHVNHALVHPPVDRHLPPDEVRDVYVHAEGDNDAGVIVSGAKVVATGSALTHHNFIAHHGMPVQRPEFALAFMAPVDTPGCTILCRTSYAQSAAANGSPFDYPLSSRMDENDTIIVFDKALIPWENILVYRDVEMANGFFHRSGFLPRFALHGATRLAVKLEFIAGLMLRAIEVNGTGDFRRTQAAVGEVMTWRHTMRALSDAMIHSAGPWTGPYVQPPAEYALAYRVLGPIAYAQVRSLVLSTVGSGLIYLNSGVEDFAAPEVRALLDRYLRGSGGHDAVGRVKVMKLLWDAVGTEFGGRHELYERSYAGNEEDTRIQVARGAAGSGLADRMLALVDDCMASYDLDGWVE